MADEKKTETHAPYASGTTAVIAPLSAPVLHSVDTANVAAFLLERERYEIPIASRQADLPGLQRVPYLAAIDRTLLKGLIFTGELEEVAPGATIDSLTEKQIKAYITPLITPSGGVCDPSAIERALPGFNMPTGIPNSRIQHYVTDFSGAWTALAVAHS